MKLLIVSVLVCIYAASAVKNRFNSRFQRQEQTPAPIPHEIYGPPPQEYGPPPPESTEAGPTTTEIPPFPPTTEAESEPVNGTTSGRLTRGKDRGLYYIYHPNGQLQKVVYSAKQDSKTKTYTAQLKYEDVQPIREPIFTYDPQTGALTRLQT